MIRKCSFYYTYAFDYTPIIETSVLKKTRVLHISGNKNAYSAFLTIDINNFMTGYKSDIGHEKYIIPVSCTRQLMAGVHKCGAPGSS